MQTKKFLSIAAIAMIWFKASGSVEAQVPNDSISIQDLDEIVIEAPKVIHKADMDVYHPSKSAVDR